ncbi:MAG: hypothetical protein AAGA85_01865 [Bacteroidota bacterium]
MKKILLMMALCGIFYDSNAQEIRLNQYNAFIFDDRFDSRFSPTSFLEGKILGGYQWGVGVEVLPYDDYGIELSYYRQDTQVPIRYWDDGEVRRTLDAAINYIMAGGARYLDTGGPLEGYAGVMVGAVIYDNKSPIDREPNSVTRFSWGFKLGANIWATERVGLKMQAHLLSAVQGVGGGFYFGTGGSGAGVSTYSTLFQFGLGGGIVIRVGG